MSNFFGEYIKSLRKNKRLSLRAVERLSGISNSYLSQIERGRRPFPNLGYLIRLSEAYKVNINSLVLKAQLDYYDNVMREPK
jgi:transcriptional regulator with XRE-family HTH domain